MMCRYRHRPTTWLLFSLLAAPVYAGVESGAVPSGDSASGSVADDEVILSLQERLAAAPDDVASRAELARSLGRAGRYREALVEYDTLIRRYPDDADHALGKAQVLYWLGDYRGALAELDRAKTLAPDYEDVWKLQLAAVRRLPDEQRAGRLTALRGEASTRFPESTWWQDEPPGPTHRWRLTLGAGYENLSGGLQDWDAQFLQLDWLRSADARYFARLARDTRFDNTDSRIAAGAEWRLAGKWTGGLELETSATANFQPSSGASLHAGRRLERGWGIDARWRQRRYDTATVSIYTGTAERYFGNYRAAYGLHLARLHGHGDTLAHTLALNWFVNAQHSFGVVLANGEEAEAVGPGTVVQTSVTSATVTGRHLLSERITLSWWAGRHRQGDLYRREYAGLAIAVGI